MGDYELIGEIARGGMGVVYRAWQISLKREVAVKLIRDAHLAAPALVKRFRFEAEAAARLDHPSIVPIYEIGDENGQHYFSMKLIEGGTLADRLAKRPEAWAAAPGEIREAVRLMIGVARAVHHAHQRGVLHRDLKPTNILLDRDGQPHVTDFGLAKLVEDTVGLTLTNAVMGTPAYMAPEQASGPARDLTTAADVHGLGAILYEQLTGRPPFSGRSTAELLRQVIEADPAPPSRLQAGVDPDLETICLKCLRKDPASRYDSAGALADELERWLEGRPIQARPTTAFERSWRWSRRNPWLAGISAAFLLTMLAGGLAVLNAYRETGRALARSREAESAGLTNLHAALMSEARALSVAGQRGQRDAVLAAMAKAAAIRPDFEVRSQVAAALARPEFALESSWPVYNTLGSLFAFTSDLTKCLVGTYTKEPTVEFLAAGTGKRVRRFPAATKAGSWFEVRRTLLSPDDQHFVVFYTSKAIEVWATNTTKPVYQFEAETPWGEADFAPDGREVLWYDRDRGFERCVLATQDRVPMVVAATDRPRFIRIGPTGTNVALLYRDRLDLCQYPGGERIWSVSVDPSPPWISWRADGTMLAVASRRTFEISLLNANTGGVESRLNGHTASPSVFEFHPTRPWLVSNGADYTLRLWDLAGAQTILRSSIGALAALQFSKDGTRLASGAQVDRLGVIELKFPLGFRELEHAHGPRVLVENLALSRSERFLLGGAEDGIRLWEVDSGRLLKWIAGPRHEGTARHPGYRVFWGTNDHTIIYENPATEVHTRSLSWSKDASGHAVGIEFSVEAETSVEKGSRLMSVGADGRSWLTTVGRISGPGAEVLPDGNRSEVRPVTGRVSKVISVELSPDQRWAASLHDEKKRQLQVCDAKTFKVVSNLKRIPFVFYGFSPGGRWLMAGGTGGHYLWETGSWRHHATLAADFGEGFAFAHDGLVAVRRPPNDIVLVSLPSARELVRLTLPMSIHEPTGSATMVMNQAGNRLWILEQGSRVFEWDLSVIRAELVRRGLDWKE